MTGLPIKFYDGKKAIIICSYVRHALFTKFFCNLEFKNVIKIRLHLQSRYSHDIRFIPLFALPTCSRAGVGSHINSNDDP